MDGKVCLRCKGKTYFALLSQVNLNFHRRWRWWDQIQTIFLYLFCFIKRNRFRFLALIVHLLGRHVMWKMTRVTDNSILVPVNRFCSHLVKELHANILGSTLKTTVKVGGHFNLRLKLGSKLHLEGGFFWPWFFIILKDSDQDLSNEGSNFILSSLEVGHWVAQT